MKLKQGDILIVESIGFQNKEVSITTQNKYEIILNSYQNVCKKCDRKKKREIKDSYKTVVVFFLPNQIKGQILIRQFNEFRSVPIQ